MFASLIGNPGTPDLLFIQGCEHANRTEQERLGLARQSVLDLALKVVAMQETSQASWARTKQDQLLVLYEADMRLGRVTNREFDNLHGFVFLLTRAGEANQGLG
jgi:hypothetical protein